MEHQLAMPPIWGKLNPLKKIRTVGELLEMLDISHASRLDGSAFSAGMNRWQEFSPTLHIYPVL